MKETSVFRLLNPAGIVTLAGLGLALASMFAVMRGRPELSLVFLYLCIWCDRVDGLVARRLNIVSEFGAELDNLSDAIAFGAAPAFFIYSVTNKSWMIPFALLITFAAVLRLARYSYVGLIEREGKKYFVGLPVPYTAGILFFIWAFVREFDTTVQSLALAIYAVILSALMVSAVPIRKGAAFEKWVLFIVFPIIFIYYVLCAIDFKLW